MAIYMAMARDFFICECVAYHKIKKRHNNFKREFTTQAGYHDNYTKNPAFCELMHKPFAANFSPFYDKSILYGTEFFEQVVDYIGKMNPCFTLFECEYTY